MHGSVRPPGTPSFRSRLKLQGCKGLIVGTCDVAQDRVGGGKCVGLSERPERDIFNCGRADSQFALAGASVPRELLMAR